jgi:hypothetical protein
MRITFLLAFSRVQAASSMTLTPFSEPPRSLGNPPAIIEKSGGEKLDGGEPRGMMAKLRRWSRGWNARAAAIYSALTQCPPLDTPSRE